MQVQQNNAAIEYVPDLLVLQNKNAEKVTAAAYLDQALNEQTTGQAQYSEELRARCQRLIR